MNNGEFELSMHEIIKLVGKDKSLMIELLEVFLETTRVDLHKLYIAVNEEDVKECGRVAHKLCSTYGYFTGAGVAEVMGLIEQNMKLGKQVSSVSRLLTQKQQTIDLIESHVEKYLLRLKSVDGEGCLLRMAA